jgi:monoamine oxidase
MQPMNNCDVVIIGAGLAGASAAAKLGKAGLDVVVISARDRVGGRALAKVLASDWRDWVNDPFACGTWMSGH